MHSHSIPHPSSLSYLSLSLCCRPSLCRRKTASHQTTATAPATSMASTSSSPAAALWSSLRCCVVSPCLRILSSPPIVPTHPQRRHRERSPVVSRRPVSIVLFFFFFFLWYLVAAQFCKLGHFNLGENLETLILKITYINLAI